MYIFLMFLLMRISYKLRLHKRMCSGSNPNFFSFLKNPPKNHQYNDCKIDFKVFYNCIVVCTDLWGKELHRQVGVGIVVTSGKPMWCNGSTLAWNAKDVGSCPALGRIFPIFITPMTIAQFSYMSIVIWMVILLYKIKRNALSVHALTTDVRSS